MMSDLPMPSEVRKLVGIAPETAAAPASTEDQPRIEPPSVKLIVRLFLIPLLIAAAVVIVMALFAWPAGKPVSLQTALKGLKEPGGERTFGLVGPSSKQRYMYAKAVVDFMKEGLDEKQRIELADELVEIVDNHVKPQEAEVQHLLLLALGRVWQLAPGQPEMNSPAAVESRRKVLDSLTRHMEAPELEGRKAAILALAMWKGREEVQEVIPALARVIGDGKQDVDVRIAATVTLGSIGQRDDQRVVDALDEARNDSDPRNSELVWNAALALTRLDRPEAKPTLMMLLDRGELAKLKVYDREKDPKNPVFRGLDEFEQQRFLVNAIEAVKGSQDPEIRARLGQIAQGDPSVRVRNAAVETLKGK
jgi:hypothetical protein